MPQISVIVPVYKVEPYLRRCVDSILAQTFADFELILVDDGSPDRCGAICDEYALQDPRIHVIHRENGGLSVARNEGVKWVAANSSSRWITFVDSDDWVHQEYLKILYEGCRHSHTKISFCHVIETSEYKKTQVFKQIQVECQSYCATEQHLERVFFAENTFGGIACGKLVDISILLKYPFSPHRIYEDSPVTCKWICEAGNVAEIITPLYYYFINPNGISKSFSIKQLDALWAKEEQEAYYRELGYRRMCAVVASSYLVSASRCYRKITDELKDRRSALKVRMAIIRKYWQYRHEISLSNTQKSYLIRNMHPHIVEAYWIVKAFADKIKRMVIVVRDSKR